VLCLKSFFFLIYLLDLAVIYVPNLSSSKILDIVNFLDFRHLYGSYFSHILFVYKGFTFSF
jgi:hypothetical protein